MRIPGILGVPRRNRNRAFANRALLLPQPHARPAAVLGDELDAPDVELIAILGTPGVRAAFQMTVEMGEIMRDGEWNCTKLPEEGVLVNVLAADNHGRYEIPFPVIFREDRWWNAHTGQELQAFVAGWRPSR